ncbi:MAG: hypothetical protein L0Y72_06280 [Gemmataceae bacterium]|nr:hypothetical protein [Gemmataceae bacterium]MCI0738634.1 hypothetical protein [Gemmataceae bacterium]
MKCVSIDAAPTAVKKFIRSLLLDASGVEVTLEGVVVCKIIPPSQLSDVEKTAQLAQVRQLLSEARDHSKGTPAPIIERKIRSALKTVRGSR